MEHGRSRRRLSARILGIACAIFAATAGAKDQPPAEDRKAAQAIEVSETLAPEQVDALLAKLTDAQVRQLLARQLHKEAEQRAAAQSGSGGGLDALLLKTRLGLEGMGDMLRARAAVVREGWPLVSGSLATSMDKIAGGRGYPGFRRQVAVLLALIAAGLIAHWGVRRSILGRHEQIAVSEGAGLGAKLGTAGSRFLLELLPFGAFCFVTLGLAVLLFEPGGADRTFHVTYATGAAIVLGAAMLSRLLLSPGSAALRLLPIGDEAAKFIHRWLLWITGAGIFAWLTAGLLILTGVPLKAQLVIMLITGVMLAVLVLVMIARSRGMVAAAIRAGAGSGTGGGALQHLFASTWHYFAILYLLVVFALWGLSILAQGPSTLWAAVSSVGVLLAFPLLDRWVGRGIDDMFASGAAGADTKRQEYAVALHRVTRVLVVVMLAAAVSEMWGLHPFGEAGAKLRQAVLASSLDLIAAVLLAVIGWQFIKIGIDRRLVAREVNGVMIEPSQRVKTLLPLARKFVVVVLAVMTVMLVLSALGVNIGPLLAGAGVVGLAIGFGAQTLVRDVITGVFFLVDDAFRVGEYIQSGNYKGTVEAIGMRSVRLRHHRGPLYTVPFGELRAIQNMSRDWVIDKVKIGITYDSDIEKARKLIKQIGKDLAQDPELGPKIIETLKMQGVEEFGDFAVQIRLKMTTKPGEQFVIRRKAYAMIKKAFDANGIKFAYPTVQVAGGGEASAAVAREGLALTQPQPPAA